MLNPAVERTLALLLLIGVGLLLRKKLPAGESTKGLKTLILAVALPATIFLALLKLEVKPHLLVLPGLALLANLSLLGLGGWLLRRWHVPSARLRTLLLLFGSLAPGLSCFPFVAEYLGEESLALVALADVGNKVFVLILLYLLAMRWHHGRRTEFPVSRQNRLHRLLKALWQEPVSLVIVSALLLLSFGLDLTALPGFVQQAIGRLGGTMTPLVMVFIGLAIKLRKGDFPLIAQMLLLRAGLGFGLSAVALSLLPALPEDWLLLVVAFPQSACSFWPFAHMSAVDQQEEADRKSVV